jgi:L-ascorbate metabolism protein UlaG (beta-lactamase superfamily)
VDAATLLPIGNATVLLRACGFTVLTDPNFLHAGERAWLGWGMWSRRLLEPALGVDELPPLDAVVLSHVHGDHWDRRARAGLDRGVPVLTTPQAARRLRRQGFAGARGLATWDSHRLERPGGSLRVTATPGRHGPGPLALALPQVHGHVLDFSDRDADGEHLRLRVYLSGDTLVFEGTAMVGRRWPDLDVGVVHLGGTTLPPGAPRGLVVTLDGPGGADLVEQVRPRLVVPVHHGEYGVMRSPVEDFTAELQRRGWAGAVEVARRGHELELPQRPRP